MLWCTTHTVCEPANLEVFKLANLFGMLGQQLKKLFYLTNVQMKTLGKNNFFLTTTHYRQAAIKPTAYSMEACDLEHSSFECVFATWSERLWLVEERLLSGLSLVGFLPAFCCFFLGGVKWVSLVVLPAVSCESPMLMTSQNQAFKGSFLSTFNKRLLLKDCVFTARYRVEYNP